MGTGEGWLFEDPANAVIMSVVSNEAAEAQDGTDLLLSKPVSHKLEKRQNQPSSSEVSMRSNGGKHHHRRRWLAGIVISATTLGIGGEIYTGDPLIAAKTGVGFFAELGPGPVPETTQERVKDLLAQPDTLEIERLNALGPSELEKYKVEYHSYCLSEANRYGLHLINDQPYTELMKQATSINAITNILNAYTGNYGFKVSFDQRTDIEDVGVGVHTIVEDQVDVKKFRVGAIKFMNALFYMPTEIADFAQLRGLRLVQDLESITSGTIGSFKPAAEANPVTGILYFPIDSFYEGDFMTIMHEISHRVDFETSGMWGMLRDKQFKALNDPGFKYGDPLSPGLDKDVVNPYSGTDPTEDKATLYQDMLNGLDPRIFAGHSPVLREKYRMLLARLEQHIPNIAEYLSAISNHTLGN